MGSYAFLSVDDAWLLMWREGYDGDFAALFRDEESSDQVTYTSTAGVLLARLSLLGHTKAAADAFLADNWTDREVTGATKSPEAPETLVAAFAKQVGTRAEYDPPSAATQTLVEQFHGMWQESSLQLRFVLDRVPPDCPVQLDLSQITWVDGFTRSPTRCQDDRESMIAATVGSLPTIVLTEGSTDSEFLSAGLELLRPQYLGFLTFFDYGMKPAGGVDTVVKGARALAAAKVGNRVVAVLDNDAAGASGAKTLAAPALPSTFKVIQLPELQIATSYPTHGPTGKSEQNVNGDAVAIEMFAGEDVLRDADGDLTPVVYSNHDPKSQRWQGALRDKTRVQQEFREKIKRARSHGIERPNEWIDLGAAIDHIIDAVLD